MQIAEISYLIFIFSKCPFTFLNTRTVLEIKLSSFYSSVTYFSYLFVRFEYLLAGKTKKDILNKNEKVNKRKIILCIITGYNH